MTATITARKLETPEELHKKSAPGKRLIFTGDGNAMIGNEIGYPSTEIADISAEGLAALSGAKRLLEVVKRFLAANPGLTDEILAAALHAYRNPSKHLSMTHALADLKTLREGGELPEPAAPAPVQAEKVEPKAPAPAHAAHAKPAEVKHEAKHEAKHHEAKHEDTKHTKDGGKGHHHGHR